MKGAAKGANRDLIVHGNVGSRKERYRNKSAMVGAN